MNSTKVGGQRTSGLNRDEILNGSVLGKSVRTSSGQSIIDFDILQLREFGLKLKIRRNSVPDGEDDRLPIVPEKPFISLDVGMSSRQRSNSCTAKLVQRSMLKCYGLHV